MDLWANKVQEIRPFVVELDGEIVGYADVQLDGYVDHFFVSGAHPRQGIGTLLMARIHEEAKSLGLSELTSDVSTTAEPFFALHGFKVVERRLPVLRGVTVQNSLMRKELQRGGCASARAVLRPAGRGLGAVVSDLWHQGGLNLFLSLAWTQQIITIDLAPKVF